MLVNGTTYNDETPARVASVLESARCSGERLRLFYGDTKTGKPWNEENDLCGRIGRSMGPIKIPLLIHSSRSFGGPGLLEHCIVAIKSKRGWLYKHPDFALPETEIKASSVEGYESALYLNGEIHANLKSHAKAKRLEAFMRGERLAK